MPRKINKISRDLWIGAEHYGYAPKFKNTISQRGSGFSTGFGTSHIMEDVLSPPPKEVHIDWHNRETFYNAGYSFVSSTHGDFIDMRINSVHNRQTLTRFSQFILFPILILTYLTFRLSRDDTPWFYLQPVELGMFVFILLLCSVEICRPIKTPVRFHHKNQEVYVYHKNSLYRIPWKECEIATMFAPHHVGYGAFSDAYNLNLWLYPKHCVNNKAGDQPVALNLVTSVDGHADTYIYWEYVRRFMIGGQNSIGAGNEQKPFLYRFPNRNWSLKARVIGWFLSPIFYGLLPFISPSQFAIRFNPIKSHWPEEVHKWTGKTVNWH
ncbi:hypothetical protein A1OO_11115 [Enterovibrio norvegicus FF-33]|uniref:DUF6708 domain-containing protein n=1 Tax=Enterovibrio norvegicus TaxID=188144 RepID=UPI00031EBC58|nr:DUF6708 domain-containing protein [Enterovibrio norvegicus]OEE66329.1 hypothetical protein A1OO_11115 [Enterovibrio norvegicus FF-33]